MNDAPGAGTAAAARPAAPGRHDWLPYAFITLLVAVLMLVVYGRSTLSGFFPDTDDTMRMVEVRDFLAGQGWYDMTATRLAPPGIEMHWSRLVDLPIAMLTAGFSWAVDPLMAERLAALVWPLVLLAVALGLVGRLAASLAGPDGVLLALGMVAASFCLWNFFPPGRVDHHNVQLILGLGYVIALTRIADGPRTAAAAGFLAAGMAAVGMEGLPWIAAGTGWLALVWVVGGERCAAALRAYGVSLAIGSVLLLLVQRAPSVAFSVRCDALSVVHVGAAVLGSIAIWLLVVLDRWGRGGRLLMLGVAGAAVLGAVFLAFPGCTAGPYAALPPDLVARWLAHVGESRSLLQVAASDVGMLSQYSVAALGVVAAVLLALRDRPRRTAWSLIAVVVGVSLAVGFLQVRAVVPATVLAALPIAAVAVRWKARAVGPVLPVLFFLGGLLAGSTFAQTVSIEAAARLAAGKAAAPAAAAAAPCWTPAATAAAAALPHGLVLAPIDLGPEILYFTPHSIVGAPYHRNGAGNLAVLDAFAATPADAVRLAGALGAGHIFFCPGEPRYEATAPDSLDSALERGDVPAWLTPILGDPDARIRLYRIDPAAAPGT